MSLAQANYFLAIDAGGTKTDYLLADGAGETLARVRSGSIKVLSVREEVAAAELRGGLAELQRVSGADLMHVTRTCVGTSGASVARVADWVRAALGAVVGGELILCGDEEIALDAAFQGKRGLLVLAGTGSNVVGRTAAGHIESAGGWGPAIGDEGSGHWLGHQAVRRVFRALDEGRETTLMAAIERAWQLGSRQEVVARANAVPPPPFSQLAEAVLHCAEAGDALAAELLADAGNELARQALLILRRMEALEPGAGCPPIAIAGSILVEMAPVRAAMERSLRLAYPTIEVAAAGIDPVLGALWRARAGEPCTMSGAHDG